MARRKGDLEFAVDDSAGQQRIFKTFPEACAFAVSIAASHGRPVDLDVLTFTRAAAKAWAGDYGVEVYNEDPEASVHERIQIRADAQGRIA